MIKQFQVLTLIAVLGFSGAASAAIIPGLLAGVLEDGTLTSGRSGDLHPKVGFERGFEFPRFERHRNLT